MAHVVPGVSKLGPLMFIAMINDLYYSVKVKALLFADDTTLNASHSDSVLSELEVNDLIVCSCS